MFGKGFSPKVCLDDGILQLAAYNHFLVVTNTGELWAFGENTNGQLGDGTLNDQETPVKVPIDGRVVMVAAKNHKDLTWFFLGAIENESM